TAGGSSRSILETDALPGLYITAEGRWLLSSNYETQRLCDEEIDVLGFQLKEWPWHWGRAQLLNDLCQGRKVACDTPLADCVVVGDRLAMARRVLTEYE